VGGIRVAVALFVVLLFGFVPEAALGGGGPGGPQFGYGHYVHEARAVMACATAAKVESRYQSCLAQNLLQLIEQSHDPADEVPRIDAYAHLAGGWLPAHCHILMHTVGREYAIAAHVTLENLYHSLPKSNDPGCSAGFGHGLLIALGPAIQKMGPKGAAAECSKATTRYERYSCVHGLGHAYARLYLDYPIPALAACKLLGPDDAADCAQGVFHDYWIAVEGLDSAQRHAGMTTSPRALCGQYSGSFARACWYRAYLEHPPSRAVNSVAAIMAVCSGLRGVQLKGCVTGASLIRSSDPFLQMKTCARMPASLEVACARGVQVPGVALAGAGEQLALIDVCPAFAGSARFGCDWWLGLSLNVVTNGRFQATGCPRLGTPAARAACTDGADSYEGPLMTFS
jgi:hypothetical protein